ncbi:MAG: A/G-specific adenine glycosylase [Methylococcaceae bacterium]
MDKKAFQAILLQWFEKHGRKTLPWQSNPTPYRVWVSEIMLQQTQVATVIPYFERFIERFPDIASLANASQDEVLHSWSGLGYYARARNMHRAAKTIQQQDFFPDSLPELCKLPGIGRSTAGAILSLAMKQSQSILDGNVKRVLCRFHGIAGWPGESKINRELWILSESLTPAIEAHRYNQAMMDLGATICTRTLPNCERCPFPDHCVAYREDRIKQLPTPKPKKTLPVKKVIFLILKNQHQGYYLERKPTIGLWGGLWSFPEFSNIEETTRWLTQHRYSVSHRISLPARRHSFSHYHLEYHPVLVICRDGAKQTISEPDQTIWYIMDDQQAIGLPRPISKLITQIERGNYPNGSHD